MEIVGDGYWAVEVVSYDSSLRKGDDGVGRRSSISGTKKAFIIPWAGMKNMNRQ